MKVHLYGNVLNNSYNLTLFLRSKGINAEMFLDNSSPHSQDYPWWEDTNLSKDTLPYWIHYYPIKPNFIFPQEKFRQFIDHFSKCDVALVCGYGPIIAQKAKVPFFFYSYGADLNITAWGEYFISALRNILHFKKPTALRALLYASYLQKRAIKKADKIGIAMGYQVNPYVVPLGVIDKMVKIRLAWDIDKYNSSVDPSLIRKYEKYEVVYFMAARHSWKSVWNDMKGNDKFISAFGKFVNEHQPNVLLILVEKGNDLNESKKLINDLGISSNVEWVREMDKDGIRAYNSLPNVVLVDQFWHNQWYRRYPIDRQKPRIGFGSGSIEALSAGKPLITVFFDEDFYDGVHPPILSAFTEDEIYRRLVESVELGKEGREELGARGREFVIKYHGWQATIDMYISVLKEIHANRKRNQSSLF